MKGDGEGWLGEDEASWDAEKGEEKERLGERKGEERAATWDSRNGAKKKTKGDEISVVTSHMKDWRKGQSPL